MKSKIRIILYLIIIVITAAASIFLIRKGENNPIAMEDKNNFNFGWAADPLWDDGKAEVATYTAERIIYGETRYFEYIHILVKETFNEEYHVKTDDYSRNDLYEVMKINKFARIETRDYPYHFLSSLFFLRDDPTVVNKFTNSSQEWCGNTFKHFSRDNTGYTYYYDSYWDQEGRGSTIVPLDVTFEDQLTYTLRTLKFEDGLNFKWKIVESQVTNKATPPVIYEGSISVLPYVGDPENPGWEVRVDLDEEKTNTYWISGTYPNFLLKMETWDGRKLELKQVERYSYWQE
ncbi:MAG: hypothetical protein KFF73_15070 [Cyclobacteriaceae bacterium]|nr:hypothetical protein [Cyclobacteriaceae bacterium]